MPLNNCFYNQVVVTALILKGKHNILSKQSLAISVVTALILKGKHNYKAIKPVGEFVVTALILKGKHNKNTTQ